MQKLVMGKKINHHGGCLLVINTFLHKKQLSLYILYKWNEIKQKSGFVIKYEHYQLQYI